MSPKAFTTAWVLALLLTTAAAGCRSRASDTNDTGAATAAVNYFEALIREDWSKAYAALHPESRQRLTSADFARLAQNYRKSIGFDANEIRLRSCEEHGAEAVAHVNILGYAMTKLTTKRRTFRDAVALRQTESGWNDQLIAAVRQDSLIGLNAD
jgi:hypothetical protein